MPLPTLLSYRPLTSVASAALLGGSTLAAIGYVRCMLGEPSFSLFLFGDIRLYACFFIGKACTQRSYLSFHGLTAVFHGPAAFLDALLALQCFSFFPRFLTQSRGAGQDGAAAYIDGDQVYAIVGHQEFANLIGMGHSTRFQDVDAAITLAIQFNIAHEHPGVDQGRNADGGHFQVFVVSRSEGCEERGDLLGLQEID